MEEFVVSYSLESEQQFWDEINEICAQKAETTELIDQALRTFVHVTAKYRDEYLPSEDDIDRCTDKLLESQLFRDNADYVRTQLIYSLLQEDDLAFVHIIASILLTDGRQNEGTFEAMNREGAFARLVDLMKTRREDDHRLFKHLLKVLYEMSRVQRLSIEDLGHVDDEFIKSLYQLIEGYSDDIDDPYHYPVIRVLLVLNEQYMVASTTPSDAAGATPPTNRVIKILSVCGQKYMTFGENIILLLNRETETSLQLLILKLLYLLFTTEATHDYFYTNDLRVLVDVIVRNLLDLPNELVSLRHTYLRVLYPLLAYTQLANPPYYKKDEILRLLSLLGGSGSAHFAPADGTTMRLVERVAQVPWLKESIANGQGVAKKLLGISLSGTNSGSSVSVVDLAKVTEKPGVQTPSRKDDEATKSPDATKAVEHAEKKKAVPPSPPMSRHSRRAAPALPAAHPHGVHKKTPPQAPPRRRTKLKQAVTVENGGEVHS